MTTPLNIAFVLFRGEPGRGGAERYVDTLGHTLASRGHRVSVIASTHGEPRGLTQVRIRAGGLTRTARYRRFLDHVDRHLDKTRYDIVHACLPVRRCDVYHAHAGLEAISLRESHLIKPTVAGQVLSLWGAKMNRKRQTFAEVEANLIDGAKPPVTICLSDRERLLAEQIFPAARRQLITLHSAPDDARFTLEDVDERRLKLRRRLGIGDHQSMYLFIGQDFERKGLATAIRALGKLPDRHAILYVLGRGDIRRYTRMAIRSDVLGRVLFAGEVNDVPGFLAAADVLVLPTRYEPFGMVVIEAMLMGVPPVVSAVAGASEVIADGDTGYVLADPGDAEAWSAAMRKAIDHRARLRQNCLAQRARFSYAAHVDAIEAIYRRITAASPMA